MRERELCHQCGGNGTVKIHYGVMVCPRCKGDCWEAAATPPPAPSPAPLERDTVFSCPACGDPSARTTEPDCDIHSGATYHCDQCGAAVIFTAQTAEQYSAPAPQGAWQPIATHDGNTEHSIIGWEPGMDEPCEMAKIDRDFYTRGGIRMFPTHWQPLPPAPRPEEG